MGRDSRDRYGYRHRSDSAHDIGDSKPGDVGDSKGTFHDRARENNNVIVDGEVRSIESHRRSSSESASESNDSTNTVSRSSADSISQSEADGRVVELTVESDGGTLETLGQYKNHQVHIDDGTPGETIRVRLESGPGYLIGRRISARE